MGSTMICGFDYGTSNCAMGVFSPDADQVSLVKLEQQSAFMPSMVYALHRDLITEQLGLALPSGRLRDEFVGARSNQLAQAQQFRLHEGLPADETVVFVGYQAFEEYLQWPGEGYFVKSPKSFLGASGLRIEAINLFEDLVTLMMQTIKARAEQQLGEQLTHTVIGRPVNFQGLNADQSNQQALDILSISAKRAGFKHVEFLYEPIAAGLSFERSLVQEKIVLVVDIGGGTTDCAMVRMGPGLANKTNRQADFLGHSGERIGGNDLDIQLAGRHLMPLFGMQSFLKSGLPVPTQAFWEAISTNDVAAQNSFNHADMGFHIQQLLRDCREPELIKRFIKMREEQLQHHIVRSAEEAKISLSEQANVNVDLTYIEEGLAQLVSETDFASAIVRPLGKVLSLMEEAIRQAGCRPELIFITGGSGQSPIIRRAIHEKFGDIEVLDGDHFGSVTSGLTVWANQIFR